ncbi:MAG: hypothetical protein Q9167_005182 [Letrouitia subvulpina]
MGIGQGYNCTTISTDVCTYSPSLRRSLDEASKSQYRYVLKNIFYIHAFFLDWFHAVNGAAGTPATSVIDGIVQEVDPEKKTNSFLEDILTALTAGLAFIPAVGPEVAAGVGVATNALVTGLQQAPGVAKAIWPTGTINSQQVQISELERSLAAISGDLEARLDLGLREIMSNPQSFVGFASSGVFSGGAAPSIPKDQNQILIGFKTFLLSKALTANGWYAYISQPPTPLTQQQIDDGESQASVDVCAPKTPGASSCYYNETLGLIWTLTNAKAVKQMDQLSSDIVSKDWAPLDLLFQGAFRCAGSGNFGQSTVNFDPSGQLDLSCFSQLDSCVDPSKETHPVFCTTNLVNGGCPVRNCTLDEVAWDHQGVP